VIALVSALLSTSAVSFAQDQPVVEDPSESARFQWGPLHFTPGIALSNVGIDNNVFNDPDNRLQDTTAAIGPAINLWTKVGPLRLAEKSSGQYLYFKQFETQRSWNTSNNLRIELPRARWKPFAEASYVNTRTRPGVEIDSRARASTNFAGLGTDLRVSGKTTLVLSGARTTTAFDRNETFLGTALANALNRYSDSEALQFRYALTPLTTFVLVTEAIQDRFETDRVKNADSYRVMPGFEFKPFALISGKAAVGYRHFNVLSDQIEDYQGVVASVDAKYMVTTSTQLAAKVDRDITFSFEETTPYYTLTNTQLTIDQRIATVWDVVASGALQSLAYRGSRIALIADHTDTGRVVGLGLGYLVGETFRVGFDVNYYSRRSQLARRGYDGLRAGASVSYGLQR
jgi:hypothetical protein